MYDLIVIGAGPGGYEAAAHAGQKGKKVLLVEEKYIGGTCLNVGCIPTKTMLKSAHVFHEAQHAQELGVNTGAVSFCMKAMAERRRQIVGQLTAGVEGLLKKSKVEIVRGKGRILARGKVAVGAETYEATNILIATGSKPAVPPIPGINSPHVLDSTGILALEEKPASLIVIGGGVIGLEFASFFRTVGCAVTVIEMLPQIGGAIDGEMAKRLQQEMKKQGIEFFLESRVSKIEGGTVFFTGKDGQEAKVSAEKILCATGRAPVIEGLGLDEAGVCDDRRGIKTDEYGKTNVGGIWACGDVTGRCLLAHAATREGLVAVANMFGGAERMRYDAMPGVVYTFPEVAGVGQTEDQLKAAGVAYRKSGMPMAIAGRFTVEHPGQSGTVKVLVGQEHGEILGVHMIGGPCGELIHSAALMIELEMTVEQVKEIIFPHPTISEALKETIIRA